MTALACLGAIAMDSRFAASQRSSMEPDRSTAETDAPGVNDHVECPPDPDSGWQGIGAKELYLA